MLRRAGSSNSSSVAADAVVVKAWQVVVPEARRLSKKRRAPSRA